MSTLVLRLAGALQSWGTSSRFETREAGREPSKSGIIGLLAAAQGRRRSDPVEDLVGLAIGVRADQPGRLVRDFQTARNPSWKNGKISYRHYLGDAIFLAAIEGDDALIDGIHEAVRSPAFPLYLGRRSCPPSGPLALGVDERDFVEVLERHEWIASPWWRKRQPRDRSVRLEIVRDARTDDERRTGERVRDIPISFSEENRQYGWRAVVESWTEFPHPDANQGSASGAPEASHDAWGAVS